MPTVKDVDNDSDAARAFRSLDKDVQQILADMFVDMSTDAAEKLSTIKAAGMLDKINTTGEGGVKNKSSNKYDYTKPFAQQIDDYKHGLIPRGDTLLIGGTPKVYQSIGFNALPMTINTTHVDYALNGTKDADHYMGEAMLKQLPQSIENPIAVFLSNTHDTTSVIALLNFTVNGKQTVAPIVIDGFGFQNNIRIDSNSVTSVYGKNTAIKQLYEAAINDAKGKFALLYANKKEAVSLLRRAGHQLSGRLIPHDGFYHSIRESASPVKPKFESVTEAQQFKRWFGDWKKHPSKASKIVNADGTPKIMYHGSPAQFTIFDKKKAKGSGQYGRGFYFTDSQTHAGSYGQLYSVYLNIRNPLQYGGEAVSRAQVRKFLEAIAENEDYSIENYGSYDVNTALQTIMGNEPTIDAFQVIQDINATAIGDMVEATELFNTVNGTKFDGIIAATETVAFYPEQIKSATDNIGTFDGGNPDIRYKVSAAKDTEYMRAVNSWDKETQQKLVDEAAVDAGAILADDGKPLKLYRGTLGGQTKFAKEDTYGGKVYTIDNVHVATRYGDKSGEATEMRYQTEGEKTTYALYGFPKKMLTMDAQYGVWSDLAIPEELRKYADGRYKATNAEIADWAEQEGYDALRINNVRDGSFDHGSEVIFFNENAVKSADPVTYDNDGNVIPLSERFTESKNDLRYKTAVEEDLSDATILSRVSEENLTPGQKHNLQVYRERLAKVEEQKKAVEKVSDELSKVRQSNDPGKEAKIRSLRIQLQKEKNRLKIHTDKLDAVVNSAPIRELIAKEREAAEIRDKESIDRILSEMRGKYGTIPSGEKAVRDDSLPVSTKDDNKVSRSARTVKGAAVTTDEMAQMVDREVANGRLTYIPITNEDTAAKANSWVKKLGWESAKFKWYSDVDKGKAGAAIAARGAVLLNNAANAG